MLKTDRIHSLDSLRAIMMFLVIVSHSALTYSITYFGHDWEIKDPLTTDVICDAIVILIQPFIMPLFFMVSGFFGALLFYENSPIQMLKNRILRLVFPFVVFLFILYPITEFSFSYTSAVFARLENPFELALKPFSKLSNFIPDSTEHLWFLYYLLLITGTVVVLALLLKKTPKFTHLITFIFEWIIQKPFVRILFFSFLIILILATFNRSMEIGSFTLRPDLHTFIFYLFFYFLGWILFKSKNYLDIFMRYDWVSLVMGIILNVIRGLIIKNYNLVPNSPTPLLILLSSFSICFCIFGIIGLFIRYSSYYSSKLGYISQASYWVYLIHMPITAILPAFIWKFAVPAVAKFLIVFSVTTMICFLSYHYLVRRTFIGIFLNGRKNKKIFQTLHTKPI
ncbi:MAG: acyltransferase family protein [Sediminibacterium sp.]|nr:acyltransferase family protein [Sediminibacterium sp.]